MKVIELITLLEQCDEDADVCIQLANDGLSHQISGIDKQVTMTPKLSTSVLKIRTFARPVGPMDR